MLSISLFISLLTSTLYGRPSRGRHLDTGFKAVIHIQLVEIAASLERRITEDFFA